MQSALTFTIQERTCQKHGEQTANVGETAAAPTAAAVVRHGWSGCLSIRPGAHITPCEQSLLPSTLLVVI